MDVRNILITCNGLGQISLVVSGAVVMSGWYISGFLLAIVGIILTNGALLVAVRCKMIEPEAQQD